MKHLMLLLIVITSLNVFSQKLGKNYIPSKQQTTPEWFLFFYDEDFEKAINVFDIDKQVKIYEDSLKTEYRLKLKGNDEILTGEEHEDIYLRYYKRWRRYVGQFLTDQGNLKNNEEQTSRKNKLNSEMRNPGSSWNLLGPISTWWKYQDNSAQPQAPWQANIYACAMAYTNHNILYAAPETGGIFKTLNKGTDWSLILDQPNVGNSNIATYSGDAFYSVILDPQNENIVYAGRKNLIKKSIDGGANWSDLVITNCGDVNEIVIDPTNTSILYAACANGLYKSTDAGNTWTLKLSNTIWDVALKPGNTNTVYALRKIDNAYSKFHFSVDNGENWTESFWSGNGIVADNGSRMTVTVADPDVVFAVVLVTNPEDKPYIFRSIDSGISWSLLCTGQSGTLTGNSNSPLGMSNGQGYFDLDILADPNNAASLIVATTSSYKSVNALDVSNVTFIPLGGYSGSFTIHPDIQCMIAHQNDTWIATDGGMNYSSDFFTSTSNYSCRSAGIYGTDFWGFTQAWNEDIVAGGKYHNGNTVMNEDYPAGNSLRLGGGESPTGYYMVGRPRHIVFSDLSGNGVIVPQTFSGNSSSFSFTKLPNENNYGWNTSEVEFLPYCFGHVFLGKDNELWKSTDAGVTWSSVYNFNSSVKQIEISRSNPEVMYVCTDNNLWKTTNGGSIWNTISLPTGQNQTEKNISLSFTDENTLWICAKNNTSGNRVFTSTNGGATWTNLTTGTINAGGFWNIVHHAGTDGGVYIFRKGGEVYYRNNNLSDWVPFSASLPDGYYPLRSIPFYRDGKLRSAGNRGIWEVEFYENNVPPIAQPTVDKLTTTCARDTFYFDDYSALNHSGASWNWTFSGTSNPVYVSSTTIRNPKVVFGSTGTFDFSLSVTNSAGSNSKSVTGKIQITVNECEIDTIPGKLLKLTSTGDYAQQTAPMNILSNNITLSAWIKPNGNQVSGAGIIFSSSGTATGLNFKTNNQLGYHWNNSGGSYNWSGGPTVVPDEWSHVALVISNNSATIYLNGVGYTRTGTNIHPIVNFDKIFQFGIDRSNTSRNFKGDLDEICIYNRALTESEIRELFHLTKNNPNIGSMPGIDPDLKSYYQINEGAGKPIYDRIGTNHAVVIGSTSDKSIFSSAPVGGGRSFLALANSAGLLNFSGTDVVIGFPASGPYPNGILLVTKLNLLPHGGLNENGEPERYWIIHNYGTNQTFNVLDSILLSQKGAYQNCPSTLFELFKRGSNAEGTTWGSAIDISDNYIPSTETVVFSSGNNITSFSQIFMVPDLTDNPLMVTQKGNDGPKSLRAILACASSGDTIRFSSTVDTITITSPFILNKNLTLMDEIGEKVVIKSDLNLPGFDSELQAIKIESGFTIEAVNIKFYQLNNIVTKPVIRNFGTLKLKNCLLNGIPPSIIRHETGANYISDGIVEFK